MIGHQQQRPFAEPRQLCQQRPENQLVDSLDRLDLVIGSAHVAGLIGRLDMQQEEVTPLERVEAITGLRRIVSIEKSGRAGNRNYVEAGEPSAAIDQISRRNNRAFDAEAILK